VTLWGFTDAHSWITEHPATFSGQGAAHPFDERYRAKPAAEGIRQALPVPVEDERAADGHPEASSAPSTAVARTRTGALVRPEQCW
jgi:hypothetical protein